jgi:hypothetical protein
MLLTNRRHRTLYIALAGMEMGWMLPYILLFIHFWSQTGDRTRLQALGAETAARNLTGLLGVTPLALYAAFLGTMLLYMLAADLLNKSYVESPWREIVMALIVLGTSLLMVRVALYPVSGLDDWRWLSGPFNAVFNFTRGRRPELAIILINALIWFRVASNTDREFTFFRIGLSFRMGMLAAILGGGLLAQRTPGLENGAILYFLLFFGFGLTAVSLARMDEKALTADHSSGALLPWSRLAQIIITVAVTLGAGLLAASLFYTPRNLRTALAWFSPLWRLLGLIVSRLLLLLALILTPLIDGILRLLHRIFDQSGVYETPTPPKPIQIPDSNNIIQFDLVEALTRHASLRYGLTLVAIMIGLGIIWIFFARTRQRARRDEAEEYADEALEMDGSLLRRGLDQLRNWADMVRRYGVSSRLLAAISVENIYANTGRLARRRGYPRHRSQSPDEYLSVLEQAFPGCQRELERITTAYMRVEYGDLPTGAEELTQLRADFTRLRQAPPPAPSANDETPNVEPPL